MKSTGTLKYQSGFDHQVRFKPQDESSNFVEAAEQEEEENE